MLRCHTHLLLVVWEDVVVVILHEAALLLAAHLNLPRHLRFHRLQHVLPAPDHEIVCIGEYNSAAALKILVVQCESVIQ